MDLPRYNLERLAKKVLPPSSQLSAKTVDSLRRCSVEFVTMLTSAAEGLAKADGRKTIIAEDFLEAMAKLGLDHYSPALRLLQSSIK